MRIAAGEAGRWPGGHHRTLRIELRARLRLFGRELRNSDLGILLAALCIGAAIGVGVALVQMIVLEIHHLLFDIPFEARLSSATAIEAWRVMLVPALGGLAYGILAQLARRWRPGDIVDAIEANALYGGRMSLTDSVRLTALTMISAGVGASVGLEAAYTQLGSGTASWIGRALRLRRSDLRTFVGCGAAAAIAAAFNAPLAGAFYAYELIIGSYTLANLAPVAIAALAGALVERNLFGGAPIYVVYDHVDLAALDYAILAVLGVAGAGLGIGAMTGVTMVESWFRRVALRSWLRPAAGGLALGLMALIYPQVLGSGHGGIVTAVGSGFTLPLLLGLIVAKLFASAISIGSGFRGGMFSSSLFIGSLFGGAVGMLAAGAVPMMAPHGTVFILAGMGAVAAAVVGAPVTMILLVLEVTSDFSATIGVTAAVLLASFTVRHWFGYSFATWRFHLRGVPLHGAYDIGWLQDLTVGRVMRRDFATVAQDLGLAELRRRFPVGGPKIVFAVDETGRYAGLVDIQEAHNADLDPRIETARVADLVSGKAHFLTPGQPVRVALDLFLAAAAETLAVVDDATDRRVIGFLTEAYALRRYNRELEARRREELGENELFSPTRAPPEP
ncbi:MAG: chloride channel protein [Alphaproteobacteria bacterium]|nr:chloride channel protein [Alphaproteobacteria bacterium]